MLGGGLGSQPRHADELYAFLAARKITPMMEAVIRLFYRYGERKSRAKARLKFQLKNLGLENFRALVIAITDKPEINMMVYNDCRSRH